MLGTRRPWFVRLWPVVFATLPSFVLVVILVAGATPNVAFPGQDAIRDNIQLIVKLLAFFIVVWPFLFVIGRLLRSGSSRRGIGFGVMMIAANVAYLCVGVFIMLLLFMVLY